MLSGACHFTEINRFCGWPNISVQQQQTSLIKNHQQNSSDMDHSYGPARKKRLTMDQTKSLECSFAMDNKLEPERKKKLAIELGLQPRQVAIWYQNRRARTKTKTLEEKYVVLNMQYQNVLKEKKKLDAEVNKLKEELLGLKERENLGKKCDKLHCTMQGGTSILSTNNKEPSFSTMDVQQQQLGMQGRERRPQCSENNSSKSAQNQPTFSTNRPGHDGKFNEANIIIRNKQALKPQHMPSYPPQEEDSSSNHHISAYTSDTQLYQHQQQQEEILQHFQPQYQCFRNIMGEVKLGSFEYITIPSAPLAQFHGSQLLLDDYQFKREDEGTQHLELATRA
ncbi:hypothetical protein L7F22_035604 [Adiantum nelumboides]|nr:hypothetical protein [Adiantum nelumboides]